MPSESSSDASNKRGWLAEGWRRGDSVTQTPEDRTEIKNHGLGFSTLSNAISITLLRLG